MTKPPTLLYPKLRHCEGSGLLSTAKAAHTAAADDKGDAFVSMVLLTNVSCLPLLLPVQLEGTATVSPHIAAPTAAATPAATTAQPLPTSWPLEALLHKTTALAGKKSMDGIGPSEAGEVICWPCPPRSLDIPTVSLPSSLGGKGGSREHGFTHSQVGPH